MGEIWELNPVCTPITVSGNLSDIPLDILSQTDSLQYLRLHEFNIKALCLVLKFPKVFPMGKSNSQIPNLGESDKIGNDPASRLASCSQVIKIKIKKKNLLQI